MLHVILSLLHCEMHGIPCNLNVTNHISLMVVTSYTQVSIPWLHLNHYLSTKDTKANPIPKCLSKRIRTLLVQVHKLNNMFTLPVKATMNTLCIWFNSKRPKIIVEVVYCISYPSSISVREVQPHR